MRFKWPSEVVYLVGMKGGVIEIERPIKKTSVDAAFLKHLHGFGSFFGANHFNTKLTVIIRVELIDDGDSSWIFAFREP